MNFKVITLFPEVYESFMNSGPIRKGLEKKIINFEFTNLKNFGIGKHKKVDETPYGGGAGMLLMVEPIDKAISSIKTSQSKVVIFTPEGKEFKQEDVLDLSKHKEIIFLSGYYEGFDNRIKQYVDYEYSIGDFIVSRGDIPIIAAIDAISRVKGDVINGKSLEEESFNNDLLEYPQYTNPKVYNGNRVPEVLTSGNHKLIEEFRMNESIKRTKKNRPDLYNKYKEKNNGS